MSQETKKQQESYNTTDLAAEVAKQFSMPKAQALRVVSAVFTFVGNAVSRGATVRLHQFGNFKKLETKERQGRNPKTGEATTIEASSRPHFVSSQTLKAKVKSGAQDVIGTEVETEGATAPAPTKPAPAPKTPSARKPVARKPVPKQAPQVSNEPAVADPDAIDEL